MYAERLIAQMKSRPALWDLRNYNYNNRTLCDREWSKMAEALGFEKDAVKAKWKSLRDTYRRELRKAKLGQKSSWVHYPRMSFLRDALEARDRRRAAADTTTRDGTSPAPKWYADDDGYCPDETAMEVLQQNGDGTQDGEEEEEESFPVIKEEPDIELTMDDISVRGYGEQSTTWMDENNLEDNPKKMFLLSLLPDLEQMSEPQMRLFKKSVLQLTCEILDSNNGDPLQQQSNAQSSSAAQGQNVSPD
uniref:Putative alcohol dehydrogenase transcription factor myb/sant-like protein n=1 Tax=Panstrongylus lignarius TaxID=156445 RepID=A0A224XV23_9HEMI